MADVKIVKSIYTLTDVTALGELTAADNAALPGSASVASLTASQAVFTDGSKMLVSNAITGTGSVVMSASPTFTGLPVAPTVTLTNLTDTAIPKHTSDAVGLADSVIKEDASGNLLFNGATAGTSLAKGQSYAAGTAPTTSPADVVQFWTADHFGTAGKAKRHYRDETGVSGAIAILDEIAKAEKIRMINSFIQTLTSAANVRLLLSFDQSGAVSTITDRVALAGVTPHVVTLRDGSLNAINASTCSPGISGVIPYLSFDTTHVWNTPDADNLSFGDGTQDFPFSMIVLFKFITASTQYIIGKYDLTTGAEKREYTLVIISGKIYAAYYDETTDTYIGRYYNSALSADNIWHSIIVTKGTGVTCASIKIYLDSVQVDDADYKTGVYNYMENTTALVGSYVLNASGVVVSPFLCPCAFKAIVAEELTATQVKMIDAILRSSVGVAI